MHWFNENVRPHDNSIWNDRVCEASHWLHSNHPSIVAADKIELVWSRFHSYISSHIGNNQKSVLIGWNGASCNKKWIYKSYKLLIQIFFPTKMSFLMDLMKVNNHYKTFRLNLSKSKGKNMSIGATVVTTQYQFAHYVITRKLSSGYLTVWCSHVICLYMHYQFKTLGTQSERDTEVKINGGVGFRLI